MLILTHKNTHVHHAVLSFRACLSAVCKIVLGLRSEVDGRLVGEEEMKLALNAFENILLPSDC